MRALPSNDDEQHFVTMCMGHAEPRSARELLWLYAQMVCQYERSVLRAARTYLVEHENSAPRIQNRFLKADLAAAGRSYMEIRTELKMYRGAEELTCPICNVAWATLRFALCERSPEWTMFESRPRQ